MKHTAIRDIVQKHEKLFRGRILTEIYFRLLKWSSQCKDCFDGYFYPMYGMAPHRHTVMDKGVMITTWINDTKTWPKNFVEDEPGYGQGVWYCPNEKCKNSIDAATGQKEGRDG